MRSFLYCCGVILLVVTLLAVVVELWLPGGGV